VWLAVLIVLVIISATALGAVVDARLQRLRQHRAQREDLDRAFSSWHGCEGSRLGRRLPVCRASLGWSAADKVFARRWGRTSLARG
jgi:hypothetical protein